LFEHGILRERADQLFRRVAEEYGFDLIEYEISSDHVHMMLSFPPKRSIGDVVRIFKSIVARELFREFPWIKKELWAGEFWESGYFARTVGDRMTSEVIKKYIQHHRVGEQGTAQLDLELS
jgi:putative transposase